MPRRTDIQSILLIGSGPIVIGQACEFDYSGTQACKALKEDGFRVILINSNPATIMTDPEIADRTYIEPITWDIVEKIIERERPDSLLPTIGGQTGLNLAIELADIQPAVWPQRERRWFRNLWPAPTQNTGLELEATVRRYEMGWILLTGRERLIWLGLRGLQ